MGANRLHALAAIVGLLLTSAASAAATEPPAAAEQPHASFNCAAAQTKVEQSVCSDAALAADDRALAAVWKTALGVYRGAQRASLLQGQQHWLATRGAACLAEGHDIGPAVLAECLRSVYRQRIAQLQQQLAAHRRNPAADFDRVLDTPVNLSAYSPQAMSALTYKLNDDTIFWQTRHLPKTCRELYTLLSGKWVYESDTIGIVSETNAKTTCAYKMLALRNGQPGAKPSPRAAQAFEQAVQDIADEVEFHKVHSSEYGNFTGAAGHEFLAIIFANSTGTLHYYNLYLGTYAPATHQVSLRRLDTSTWFKIVPND